jgi:hypothetical protein
MFVMIWQARLPRERDQRLRSWRRLSLRARRYCSLGEATTGTISFSTKGVGGLPECNANRAFTTTAVSTFERPAPTDDGRTAILTSAKSTRLRCTVGRSTPASWFQLRTSVRGRSLHSASIDPSVVKWPGSAGPSLTCYAARYPGANRYWLWSGRRDSNPRRSPWLIHRG